LFLYRKLKKSPGGVYIVTQVSFLLFDFVLFFLTKSNGIGTDRILICQFNPLPPSDAVRKQKKIFYRISSAHYCHNLKKKHHLSGNLKFYYLGIFQSLKLRIGMEKFLSISLKLNFTPHTLGCYGLTGP